MAAAQGETEATERSKGPRGGGGGGEATQLLLLSNESPACLKATWAGMCGAQFPAEKTETPP